MWSNRATDAISVDPRQVLNGASDEKNDKTLLYYLVLRHYNFRGRIKAAEAVRA